MLTDLNAFRGVNAVQWSPDGKSLASASNDKTVRIWDASTGQVKLKLSGHNDPVRSVCFSPCGTKVVSDGGQGKDYGANEDFSIRIWEAETGCNFLPLPELLRALTHLIATSVSCLCLWHGAQTAQQ